MASFAWRRVLAYLGPLAIVPLVEARQDPDAHWHARQGVVLLVVELVTLGLLSILTGATVLTNFGVGIAMLVGLWLFWTAVVLLHLSATLVALNGGRLRVPGIAAIAEHDWTALGRRLTGLRPR